MILGIDLGQTVGWVKGGAVGPLEHGEYPMAQSSDLGLWLHSFDGFFQGGIMRGVTGISVEQPFLGSDYYPARKLISQLGHLYHWARFFQIPASNIMEVPVATGKLTLSGDGRADKTKMIAAAATHGYEGLSEHEADALGIWWVYIFGRRERAKGRPKSSPGQVVAP